MEVSQIPPSVFTTAIWHFWNYRRLHGSLIILEVSGCCRLQNFRKHLHQKVSFQNFHDKKRCSSLKKKTLKRFSLVSMSEIFKLLSSALGSAERSKLGQKIPPPKALSSAPKRRKGYINCSYKVGL